MCNIIKEVNLFFLDKDMFPCLMKSSRHTVWMITKGKGYVVGKVDPAYAIGAYVTSWAMDMFHKIEPTKEMQIILGKMFLRGAFNGHKNNKRAGCPRRQKNRA